MARRPGTPAWACWRSQLVVRRFAGRTAAASAEVARESRVPAMGSAQRNARHAQRAVLVPSFLAGLGEEGSEVLNSSHWIGEGRGARVAERFGWGRNSRFPAEHRMFCPGRRSIFTWQRRGLAVLGKAERWDEPSKAGAPQMNYPTTNAGRALGQSRLKLNRACLGLPVLTSPLVPRGVQCLNPNHHQFRIHSRIHSRVLSQTLSAPQSATQQQPHPQGHDEPESPLGPRKGVGEPMDQGERVINIGPIELPTRTSEIDRLLQEATGQRQSCQEAAARQGHE